MFVKYEEFVRCQKIIRSFVFTFSQFAIPLEMNAIMNGGLLPYDN